MCACHNNYQSVDHLIFECPETSNQEMLKKLRELGYHPPWHIHDIIRNEIRKNDKPAMKLIGETMTKKLLDENMI
jgi:hypothetical protein